MSSIFLSCLNAPRKSVPHSYESLHYHPDITGHCDRLIEWICGAVRLLPLHHDHASRHYYQADNVC